MKLPLVAAIALLACSVAARAESLTVFQEGKKFSEAEIAIKKGDSVTFSNKDPYTHNVFSATPGMAFDLRTQRHGESSDVKFDNVGEADVQCAVHPQMKMKVKVSN
jgi:plastocyanin